MVLNNECFVEEPIANEPEDKEEFDAILAEILAEQEASKSASEDKDKDKKKKTKKKNKGKKGKDEL